MTTADASELARLLAELAPTQSLRRAERLKGGISAGIFAVEFEDSSSSDSAVLRLLPAGADLDGTAEARLMRTLGARGFPVPEVLADCGPGAGAPAGAVLLEHVAGDTDLTPGPARVEAMAALLLHLHALPRTPFEPFPAQPDHPMPERWRDLDAERVATLRETALAHPPASTGAAVLCHGDFWPGNLLWRSGGGVAVLDWEDAGFGDRLLDLAIARLELAWEAGIPAMERFTETYLAGTREASRLRAALPAWDLHVTLLRLAWLPGWNLPAPTTQWCLGVGLHHAEQAAAALEAR